MNLQEDHFWYSVVMWNSVLSYGLSHSIRALRRKSIIPNTECFLFTLLIGMRSANEVLGTGFFWLRTNSCHVLRRLSISLFGMEAGGAPVGIIPK